jgi:hypothetical protein
MRRTSPYARNIPIHYFLNGVQAENLTSAYISYFPDGKEMIRGSDDKTILWWDMEVKRSRRREKEVSKVAISRDDQWVVWVIAAGL